LNLGPKDSGLCSFHYSLDYAFIILIAQLRWVPSSLYTFNSTQDFWQYRHPAECCLSVPCEFLRFKRDLLQLRRRF
jgi:hypothetical protein